MESTEKQERVREKLLRELGPNIREALADPRVIEVVLNPDGKLWVERLGEEMQVVGDMASSNAESLMATIASSLSTTITRERPVLEGELPTDGSRFEGMIPPVVVRPSFAIRKKASRVFSLAEYVRNGIMTEAQRLGDRRSGKESPEYSGRRGHRDGEDDAPKRNNLGDLRGEPGAPGGDHRGHGGTPVFVEERRAASHKRHGDDAGASKGDDAAAAGPDSRGRGPRGGGPCAPESLEHRSPWGPCDGSCERRVSGLLRIKQLIEEGLQGGKADPEVIAEAVGLVVVIKKTSVAPGRRVSEMVRVLGYKNGEYVLVDDFSESLTPTPTKNEH